MTFWRKEGMTHPQIKVLEHTTKESIYPNETGLDISEKSKENILWKRCKLVLSEGKGYGTLRQTLFALPRFGRSIKSQTSPRITAERYMTFVQMG